MRSASFGILLASAAFAAGPALAEKIFVSNEKGNTITVLDGETHEILHTIDGMQRPRGITASPDGKHVYVCA
jgi:YVTN family beta-propeller protein